MPEVSSPSTTGATPGTGDPGASGDRQVTSQGPNDVIRPETGGNAGGQQPATGEGNDQRGDTSRRLSNLEAMAARFATERDTARRELEEERRKALPEEERKRLQALDERDKQRDAREKNLILRYEIASRAPRLGIVDPETAVLLLERSSKVTVNDDLSVTGLDEALKDLIKEKPFLVKATTQSVDAGAGSGGSRTGNKPGMNDIIRGAARRTTVSQGE
jgi:hypothetical protein